MNFSWLVIAVVLLAAAQVLQKLAVVRAMEVETRDGVGFWRAIRHTPAFWMACLTLFLGAVCWLGVLYHFDVGQAFPMLGATTILVMFAARQFFDEEVPAERWFGAGLIALGIGLALTS